MADLYLFPFVFFKPESLNTGQDRTFYELVKIGEEFDMFGIGVPEMLIILTIALVVIGPKKLPDLAKSMGRAMREFKKATNELKSSIELEDDFKSLGNAFEDAGEGAEKSGDLKKGVKEKEEEAKKDSDSPDIGAFRIDPEKEPEKRKDPGPALK